MADQGNPYLRGLFAPVREEVTARGLPVSGRLPEGLDGRYLRNGPNPLNLDDPAAYHWFSGPGMVHGVRLRDGRAEWYRNRWVRSDTMAAALGDKPVHGPRHLDMDVAPNTHVLNFAGRYLATVEGGSLPYELDGDLNTLGPYDFQGTLPGGFAAHTTVDPVSGELHAVAYCWAYPYVQHLVVARDGRVRRAVDIPVTGRPMMHDFSLTSSYVLLYDLPVVFNPDVATSPSSLPYIWDPERTPRLGVLPREGRAEDVRWLEVEPCFVFHPMNAYEDGAGLITVHLVRYDRLFAGRDSRGPDETPPRLVRWTVDLAAGTVREDLIDERAVEFPRVDPRRATGAHRYGYGVLEPTDGYAADRARRHLLSPTSPAPELAQLGVALVKFDLERGGSEVHRFPPGTDVGEGVFVPSAGGGGGGGGGGAEDDGWVLSYVFDPERGGTDLVVLAAQDLSGEPVARVHLPVRVPVGFHGNWIPDHGHDH
ncbi:carotenoid oxygenase family protein [Streptomyces longispororuber]|uniref:carotenoid oxygenase family protein n=1 Tax=Streptomyces longispororuber TaxID=68230 RepID=UPI00210A069C|nr:carotenoid oxygenase family protein [Streptomyces longispororuber]MCQ4214235.1 carotenoid oxygenase family protein [Streptomyces longispororuber]